ncbi:MAG: primosomal protein N' [Coprobacillus sp.]|nr:primosomal protein N' [Coprobacillus sp.]
MLILDVYPQYTQSALEHSFSYLYDGTKNVDKGYRVKINFGHQSIVGLVYGVTKTKESKEEIETRLGRKISYIEDVIDSEPVLNDDLFNLVDEIEKYYLCGKVAILQNILPKSLNVKKSALSAPKIAYDSYLEINGEYNEDGLTPKQVEVYSYINCRKRVLKNEIKSVSIINKLLSLGKIKVTQEEKRRLKVDSDFEQEVHELTEEQKAVIDEFNSSDDQVYLLEGVTGSGKTEVYLTLAEQYLKMGKSILMLVPEIALTKAMSEYFISRFHSDVAILHSNLTPAEHYDEYRRIQNGQAKIVVGARSAIFAPLSNIGLIILDEEHTESYKQDTYPYYHARDIALMRARMHKAKVILGSATPSLESRANASRGRYHLLKLNKRINQLPLPRTNIINITKRDQFDKRSSYFTTTLIEAMQERLDNHEQIILLVNKRGFSSLTCRECGQSILCPTCKVPLIYHKTDNTLKCHHCNYVMAMTEACPNCGSSHLIKLGYGTEKVEEEVNKLFPEAVTLRLDSDAAKGRNSIKEIIDDFSSQKADILIGTQMIAKGHDFKNVTLVGVINADLGLSTPSYRSAERTYQLLTQAVGRCGRGDKRGEAIIQTYSPSHYAITCASRQNYETFYKIELQNRKSLQYPPYYFLCAIKIDAKNEDDCIKASQKILISLQKLFGKNASIFGPVLPYIPYMDGRHHRSILLKYQDSKLIRDGLADIKDSLVREGNINVYIDFDPYDF